MLALEEVPKERTIIRRLDFEEDEAMLKTEGLKMVSQLSVSPVSYSISQYSGIQSVKARYISPSIINIDDDASPLLATQSVTHSASTDGAIHLLYDRTILLISPLVAEQPIDEIRLEDELLLSGCTLDYTDC